MASSAPSAPPKPQTPAQRIAQIMREACRADPASFIKRLAEGLVPDIEDQRRNTLLHHLAKKGRWRMVERVMQHPGGPSVRRTNLDGDTALHLAAEVGDLTIAHRLIDAGADVNPRNNLGRGPLHQAAQAWHPEVVALLLAHGATPDQRYEGAFAPSMSEVSPLAYALYGDPKNDLEARRQIETMRHLLEAGADPDWPHGNLVMPNLHRSIGKPLATTRLLLKHGANPNLLYEHSHRTALMIACEYGVTQGKGRAREAVDVLIAAGADVTLTDSKGWTALHMAVRQNDAGWIDALVTAGADPLAAALDGKTPMDAATQRAGVLPEAAILALAMAEAGLTHRPEARARARL